VNQPHTIRLSSWARLVGLALLLGVGVLASLGLASGTVHAATTLTVTNCSNDSQLRADVSTANSDNAGDVITFACSGDILLASMLPPINVSMTLDGSGQNVTLDGNNSVQVLFVNSSAYFTLNALTIAHGNAVNFGPGGGLENNGGSVNISNSTFANNSAPDSHGGGLDNFGGSVSITNSTFANNSAGGRGGGGLFNDVGGTVNISNSTFANNSAPNGLFGGGGGGLYNIGGPVNITNSTFANNSAGGRGGGGFLNNLGGPVTISNSTFANNSAPNGGGLNNLGGTVFIIHSIVANNKSDDCSGGVSNFGYNLSSDSSCGFTGTSNLQNTDPKLDPNGLHNNGGPTQTIALLQGSPAIDWVASGCPSTDQRGDARYDNAETTCDIGAYEFIDPERDLGLTNVPANITADATSPQGAVVTYMSPTVVDEDSPLPTVNCLLASGSTFPIGTTTVNCSVKDSDDANSPVSASFTVTVNDTDLALTSMPANITTDATSPQGAVVTYTPPTAVEEESPLPSVSCDHASSSTFPIGTTTVTCTVSDSDDTNSPFSQSFTVTVNPVLTASGTSVSATEGKSFSGVVVATGTAYGTGTLSASVDWGDGQISSGTVTLAKDGSYSVTGSHVYDEEGPFAIKVTVSGSGGPSATASSSASVADAALTANTPTVVINKLAVTVSTVFFDANPNGTASDYTATINWGDGSSSTATISTNSTNFTATGSHSYRKHTTYTVTVTIKDAGGSSVTKTLSVKV
jgi:hypothetical protein